MWRSRLRSLSAPPPFLRASGLSPSSSSPSSSSSSSSSPPSLSAARRTALANVHSTVQLPETWFVSSPLRSSLPNGSSAPSEDGPGGGRKVDERTLALGKTIETLQSRLPTLLQSPLPSEILSPSISLHLFPTTHPHLPTVRGRVAYVAALWTAPVAWGRLPGSNVRLEVLSERMVNSSSPGAEKLIVKWRTQGRPKRGIQTLLGDGGGGGGTEGAGEGVPSGAATQTPTPKTTTTKTPATATATDGDDDDAKQQQEFCGLFIFEFDEKGRIKTHTIENADQGFMGGTSSVITVTEWLLRKARGKGREEEGLALQCERLLGGGRDREGIGRKVDGGGGS